MTSLNKAERVFNIFGVVFTVWIAWTNASSGEIRHKIVGFILFAVAACWVIIMIWGVFFRQHRAIVDSKSPAAAPRYIYIGPSGTPVSIENGKIKVDLKFVSCSPVRLLHVKVYIGSSPLYATLSDGEPDDIRAGDVFTKIVEENLESQLQSLLRTEKRVHVQGTAKFSDGADEQKFHFDAVPLFLGGISVMSEAFGPISVVFLPQWLFRLTRIRERMSTWTCQVSPGPLPGFSLEFFGGGITFPYCDYW
jgi:hypothetical protein